MRAIVIISIFVGLVGLQISAQDLQTAESADEKGELYAEENDSQISQGFERSGGGYSAPSYGGKLKGYGGGPSYGGYGKEESYGHGGYSGRGYGSGGSSYGGPSFGASAGYAHGYSGSNYGKGSLNYGRHGQYGGSYGAAPSYGGKGQIYGQGSYGGHGPYGGSYGVAPSYSGKGQIYGQGSYGGHGPYGGSYGAAPNYGGKRQIYGQGSYGGHGPYGGSYGAAPSYGAGYGVSLCPCGGYSSYGQSPNYGGGYVGASLVRSNSVSERENVNPIANQLKRRNSTGNIRGGNGSSLRSSTEVVGSAHSYQSPVIPGPSYAYSYPSPAPQVKCGSNLLISCNPSSQIAPCSSYGASYGAPSY